MVAPDLTSSNCLVAARLYACHKNSIEEAKWICEELLRDARAAGDDVIVQWCENNLHELWRLRRRMIIPGSV